MRFQRKFAFNPKLTEALNGIRCSQGNLFHYTHRQVANDIKKNRELWITRADCFLDDMEIKHGVKILKRVSKCKLKADSLKDFQLLVEAIHERLTNCYILSLSEDEHNTYLAEKYAKNETKVKFSPNFPMSLYGRAGHRNANGVAYAIDSFILHEGFVEYEPRTQVEFAVKIIDIFKNMIDTEPHVVDAYQFVGLLMQFVIFVKRKRFCKEREYRVSLVSAGKGVKVFEDNNSDGKAIIKVNFPEVGIEVLEVN